METLVRLAAQPLAFLGCAVLLVGIIYLGIQLAGGGELRKAVAIIAAGGVITGFAVAYGFSGF